MVFIKIEKKRIKIIGLFKPYELCNIKLSFQFINGVSFLNNDFRFEY